MASLLLSPLPSAPAEYTVSTLDLDAQAQWTQRLLLAIAAYHYNTEPSSSRVFGWYYHYVLGGIHSAVWDGDERLVQAIVKQDEAAIDGDDMEGRGVLHVCAEKNDAAMIPLLLSLGASSKKLDRESLTAVHVAARNGCLSTLNALLDDHSLDFAALHHGDRSLKQYRLTSALWLCVLNAQVQWQDCLIVLLSLSRAAQRRMIMDDRDDDGQTLLEAACAAGLTHAIPVLLKHGASIDLPNRQGLTPLSLAAKRGQADTVRALIANGAQPNLRFPPSLSTPLHHAANGDIASLLASVGSRPTLKNSRGVKGMDLFPSAGLDSAEAVHVARPPMDTDDPMHPQASSHAQNGGHALESCFLCQEEWSIVRKRDYCRRCGLNVCQLDSSKKLIFRRVRGGKKERVLARVCDGCYNIAAFRQREDGGVGLQGGGKLRIKKKRADDGRETSRKAAPSQSRKWEDVESEEEADGSQDADGDAKSSAAAHSRHGSTDDSYDSPVEDASGIADTMRAGIKRGFKVGLKVGGFLGGRLGAVFDNVTDGLTNMAVPKGAQRRGGAVNDLPAAQGEGEEEVMDGDEHREQANGAEEEEAAEEVRPTPTKRTVKARTTTVTETVERTPASAAQRGGSRATAVKSTVVRSRQLAAANLDQMSEMEERAGAIEEESEAFGGMAGKLKAKARRGQL